MTRLLVLAVLLSLPSAHGLCVITATGYRECFQPLDQDAVTRLANFDVAFAGLSFVPPARIDVVAELRAFAARTEYDRENRPLDLSWAAGLAVPSDLSARTLNRYAALVVDQIRLDLGRPATPTEHEVPFIAHVTWTRSRSGRSGQTWVHGRVRQQLLDVPLSLDDEDTLRRDINTRLQALLKIDLVTGDRGLAGSEGQRRRLVREVLFPALVGHGFAQLLDRVIAELHQR